MLFSQRMLLQTTIPLCAAMLISMAASWFLLSWSGAAQSKTFLAGSANGLEQTLTRRTKKIAVQAKLIGGCIGWRSRARLCGGRQ